jgi:hypothetical protein
MGMVDETRAEKGGDVTRRHFTAKRLARLPGASSLEETEVIPHITEGALRAPVDSAIIRCHRVGWHHKGGRMRALIVSLAAIGFALASLPGQAAGELPATQSGLQQPGRTADDEPKLKSAGASGRAARTLDEDTRLKSTGTTSRPIGAGTKMNRGVEDDTDSLKPAGASSRAARTIDDDAPLKPAGSSQKALRQIDDDAPLKSAGQSSKAGHELDEDVPLKSLRAATRPGPPTPRETANKK